MKRFLGYLMLLVLFGCGVESALAPRDEVRPVELLGFPKQDWRLVNNKFFLWREDMSPEQVSKAMEISRKIDDLDGEALPLNRQHSELDAKITPLKDAIREIKTELRPIKTEHEKAKKGKAKAEKALAEAEANLKVEKDKPTPSEEVLTALTAEVEAQKTALAEFDAKIEDLGPKREKLELGITVREVLLEPLEKEMTALEEKQLEIETAGREKVDEIMTVVDWYKDQPTAVTFQFEKNDRGEEKINASIQGWNMGDDLGPRNYSTEAAEGEKPTMGNVTYTEKGGIFEFDVYVYTDDTQATLRETYHFRVGRIKYDNPGGRQFFGGEVSRTSADGTVRRGLAKLVDRNN
jgi:hypothetical protein